MTESLVASPEVSAWSLALTNHNGPGVGVGLTLGGFRSLARGQGRVLENQALAFIASTPARDAGLVRRHPDAYELRFALPRALAEGEALANELCARLLKLAEAAGHTGVFGFEFYPLGRLHPLNKTDNLVQAGLTRTPLQWRRAFGSGAVLMIDLQALELPLPVSDAASNIARHGGIAPSRFSRLDNDNYFTIDSPWIIPALMSKVPIAGSVLEPAAGLGHMVIELRPGDGLAVTASDLHAYPDPLIPDIAIRDLRSIDTRSGFNWAITNLPYRDQDVLAAHLVELGARDGCNVALLTRAEWIVAGARRQLGARPDRV